MKIVIMLTRGGAQGGCPPHHFLTKMRPEGLKKFFVETVPPPPHLRVWMTAPKPPTLSEGLDPPLLTAIFNTQKPTDTCDVFSFEMSASLEFFFRAIL